MILCNKGVDLPDIDCSYAKLAGIGQVQPYYHNSNLTSDVSVMPWAGILVTSEKWLVAANL